MLDYPPEVPASVELRRVLVSGSHGFRPLSGAKVGLVRISLILLILGGALLSCARDASQPAIDITDGSDVEDSSVDAWVECWTPGTFCDHPEFLMTGACTPDYATCCRFGTTCVPCGWVTGGFPEGFSITDDSPGCDAIGSEMERDDSRRN